MQSLSSKDSIVAKAQQAPQLPWFLIAPMQLDHWVLESKLVRFEPVTLEVLFAGAGVGWVLFVVLVTGAGVGVGVGVG